MKVTISLGLLAPLAFTQVLTMDVALREALTSSTQSKIFDEKLVKSREFEHEKRGLLYPNIGAYANVGRGGQPVQNMAKSLTAASKDSATQAQAANMPDYTNVTANTYMYGLQAAGPIYTFGKLSTAIEMAKLQDESVSLSVKRSKQDLQMQVVEAYSAVVIAQARVQVLTRSKERAEETFKLLDRDFASGKGMKSDVLMAKATLKSLQPQILTSERDADAARRNFNRLLGRDASDVTPLDTLGILAGAENDPLPTRDAAIEQAVKNRADLQSLQVAARVYEGTSKIFQANYYPTIGYTGKFGILAYEPDQLASWTHRQWQIGVGVTWTIFDGLGKDGANKAQVAEWKSDARVFQFQASELQRSLEIEVDGALRDRVSADTSLAASIEGRDAATEAVSLLKGMYPGGSVRLTDVLSAEDGLRSAELGVLSARFSRIRAIAKLRLAQGQDLIIVSEEK